MHDRSRPSLRHGPLPLAILLLLVGARFALAEPGDPAPYEVPAPRPAAPPHPRAADARPRNVLVICIDGLSFGMFRRHAQHAPHLRALGRFGFVRPLESVFPSMTWSAHTSLITGQLPRHHGVLGNRWIERGVLVRPYRADDANARRQARTPSLYELAADAGWSVVSLNWPATQGSSSIAHNMPEVMYDRHLPFEYLSADLRQLLTVRHAAERRRPTPAGHLRDLFGRIAAAEGVETDMLVRDLAIALVRPRIEGLQRPRRRQLMLVHLVSGDSWFHRYGTAPWIARWAIEQADATVGAILGGFRRAGVLGSTAVFVLSDHGFAEVSRSMSVPAALRAERISGYRVALNGHAALLYGADDAEADGRVADRLRGARYAACVEAVFGPQAYAKLGLPRPPGGADGAEAAPDEHAGAPSLVVLARPECVLVATQRPQAIRHLGSQRIGFHGYLPTRPALRGVLLGRGPGIRARGIRPLARVVDVAPTLAQLMGLSWPRSWPRYPQRPFTLDGGVLVDVLAGAAHTSSRMISGAPGGP